MEDETIGSPRHLGTDRGCYVILIRMDRQHASRL